MKPKKNEKKSQSKSETKNESTNETKSEQVESKPESKPRVRLEIVDHKRVMQTLESFKLPIDGSPQERLDRLCSFFAHEERKGTFGLVQCLPDDDADPQGCGLLSSDKLDECPFCGKGGEIVAASKEVPKADRDIELNVVVAKKKAEEKKNEPKPAAKPASDKTVKVSPKEIKKKKEERGDKPAEVASVAAIIPSSPTEEVPVIAKDLPSDKAGGTAADLDRLTREINESKDKMLADQAMYMWTIGQKLAEIRDKKLWSLIRHEDGNYAFSSMNVFVAQTFDFTPDHAMLMIRVATAFTAEQAKIGVTKAKAILDAKLPDDMTAQLVAYASEKDAKGDWKHSVRQLQDRIRDLKAPQLSSAAAPTVTIPDEEDDDDEDEDGPESGVAAVQPKIRKPEMTSVSFEKREFSVPLAVKGSQVKPAKKIQDEPHGALALPGGVKIHFVVRIGEDGQVCIDGRVETPY